MVYRKTQTLVIALFLITVCIPVQTQEIEGRILIDIGHSSQDIQRILNDLVRELRINNYDVEFTKTILYLDPYDVLVIAIPTLPFAAEELDSIHQFVEKGGGLLLLGESGALSTENVENFNVLASYYGIEFQRDVVVDPENNMVLDKPYPEVPFIENFAEHPVTRNVKKIFLVSGCSMILSKKAKPLAWGGEDAYGDRLSEIYDFRGGTYEPHLERKGSDLIVMAYTESGTGKVVALGDTSLFRGRSATGEPWSKDPLEYYDHRRLALNIFDWMSVKTKNTEVQTLINQAGDLIAQGRYQEAKDILEDLKSLSPRIVGWSTVRNVTVLLTKADQGLEADRLLEEGKLNLENLNCEEASKTVEKAFTLYENLGNTLKIQECVTLLTECGDKEALLAKGDLLLKEGRTLSLQKKYAEALEKTEEAKIIYENLGNTGKVGECDDLIKEIRDYQRKEQQTEEELQRNRIILAVILIVTTVIIVVLYVWRRMRTSEEKEERRPYTYRRRDEY